MNASKVTDLAWHPLAEGLGQVAVLSIARPDAANAFSAEVMTELTDHFHALAADKTLRALILTGKGKHFSAGADLKWMKASALLSKEENERDADRLTAMFEALYQLPVPTIAVVKGAAYGGAVGLTAACDYAIAVLSAKFCLSEARLGLMPAVILPYLARKIPAGQLRRLGLSARVFGADEALAYGLVQRICTEAELTAVLQDELTNILQCSPVAQREIKLLQHELMVHGNAQTPATAKAIANLRTTPSAQAGLKAFFEKSASPWNTTLTSDWKFSEH